MYLAHLALALVERAEVKVNVYEPKLSAVLATLEDMDHERVLL